MTGHEQAQELLAPYALGAVSAAEAYEVRVHLPECPICREDLARLSEVVSALPLAVDEVQPPARLKQQILGSALAGTAAGSRFAGLPTNGGSGDEAGLRAPRQRPRPRMLWATAAVAATILAILVGWNVQLQLQVNHARDLATNGVATAPLRTRTGAGAGEITYLAQQHLGFVSLHGLATPATGRTYELWVVSADGKATAAGVFLPDGDGSKVIVVAQDIAHHSIAVTDEPGGGSPQPTSAPLITGRV